MPEIMKLVNKGTDISKVNLFKNDLYCLYKTFLWVKTSLEHLLPSNSLFAKMVNDLGNF